MLASLLFLLYAINRKIPRRFILWIVEKLEGGEFYSTTLRRIFSHYHGVDIGMYTHGGCFRKWMADPGTCIGRYCSIAEGVRILTENHPMEFKSTHGFFFNPELKYCGDYLGERKPLKIGNDVWIGYNAIIMPSVSQIGDGAVVAAGAVVNKDVPPYAVVVGNPARVVRFRFSPDTIEALLESKWWERSIDEILPEVEDYLHPLESKGRSINLHETATFEMAAGPVTKDKLP